MGSGLCGLLCGGQFITRNCICVHQLGVLLLFKACTSCKSETTSDLHVIISFVVIEMHNCKIN